MLLPLSVPPSTSQINFSLDLSSRQASSRPASFGGAFVSRPDFSASWEDAQFQKKRRRQLHLTDAYHDDELGEFEDADDQTYIYGWEANVPNDSYGLDWWVRKPMKRWRVGDPER
jgi:hypothetical protein